MSLSLGIKRKIKRLVNIPSDLLVEVKYLFVKKRLVSEINSNKNGSHAAVVIHLYYQDMWPYFSKKISHMVNSGMDLVIILPTKDNVSKIIKKAHPNAIIVRVPNQGRDILPFLKVGKILRNQGYEYVLKLHSKKSPQRQDGKDWADKMISDLTPQGDIYNQIIKIMDSSKAALIGTEGNYVPLTTYYNDNQPKVHWLLTRMLNKENADYINSYNANYGFFAGTMFWIKLSSIDKIFKLDLWANNFPPESAQLDGTIAHALERLICVVPEYSKMDIYEASSAGVKKIPHKTEYIPDWSDYYHVEEKHK